jgi:cytochrome-b5 reductase
MNTIRRFTSVAQPKSTNWALTLGVPAILAGGYYYYSTTKSVTPVDALDPNEFKDFKLKEVIPINHNTKQFRFELPSGTTQLGLPTASAIITKFQSGTKADGSPQNVTRLYTPIEDPALEKAGFFDLIVKKYPDGKMSSHIHDLKPGDTLSMKGPIKKWEYKANEFEKIGLVAGGTGITPMLQLLQRIASNPSDKTKVSLVFANIAQEDILLKEYLDKIVASKPDQFKVHYVLEKAPKGWTQGIGYINDKILTEFMPAPGKGKVFVCGPPPMVNAISGPKAKDYSQGEVGGVLKKLGYTENDVFKF